MVTTSTCPQPSDLRKLAGGHLPADEADALVQHLESCAHCLAAVQTLTIEDTLASLLAKVATRRDGPDEPAIARLIVQLSNLGNPPTPAVLSFACSGCSKTLKVAAHLAGKIAQCPVCGKTTPVPKPAPPSLPAVGATAADAPVPESVSQIKTQLPDSGDTGTDGAGTKPGRPDATQAYSGSMDAKAELWDFLAPPQQADEIGRLGTYRVLKVLGAGGMGVVFHAEDPRLKRPVALKAMLPALAASESAKKRFMREARAAAALKHDHVVTIYQVDEDRGAPFLAMEFLDGEPLDECLRREGKLPVPDVLRIGREIADGLAAAHAKDLIHRDIKPANIWLETRGHAACGLALGMRDPSAKPQAAPPRVKILDFGLARAMSTESGLTQQGAVIGTPSYMAPEQARGAAVDARSDLFSLGIVLYRMCTGRLPFLGADTVSTLMEVATHAPPAPVELNADLPRELSALVMKLLEKDPTRRFNSAAEVVHALAKIERQSPAIAASSIPADVPPVPVSNIPVARWANPDTVLCEPSSPAEIATRKPPSQSRRLPVAWLAVAGAACLGLLLLSGVVFFWQTPDSVIRVESNDPAIHLAFDGGEVKVVGAYKDPLSVKTGTHGLKIKKGDDEFETNMIVVSKGNKIILKIEVIKGRIEIAQNGVIIGAKDLQAKAIPPPFPEIAKVPTLVAEPGIRDFTEIHDADEKRFDAWIAARKKDGYRPTRLTVQTVNDGPHFTAVALQDDKKRPWIYAFDARLNELWDTDYNIIAHAMYREKGKTQEVYLWTKDGPDNNEKVWTGPLDSITRDIKKAKTAKQCLLSLCGISEDDGTFFTIVVGKVGPPWRDAANLTLDALKDWVAEHKAAGWRPDHFAYYRVGDNKLFCGILIKDPNRSDWDVSWSLTLAEYEKELTARKAEGFRPLTAVGHEDHAGAQRFSAIWIRYRAPANNEGKIGYVNKLGMKFAVVPKGKAWLGGGDGKEGATEISVPYDFHLGIHEVTHEQWEKVMGLKHPFHFSRQGEGKDALADVSDAELEQFPAENISWNECQLFLKKLNELDKQPGWLYRLPTESEWEYACRGGPGDKFQSAFSFYLEQRANVLLPAQANFRHDGDLGRPCKVGSYPANKLGLHDMHGNVSELTHNAQPTQDDDGIPQRNERGGGWTNNAFECRAAGRYPWSVSERFHDVGLRVARVPAIAEQDGK